MNRLPIILAVLLLALLPRSANAQFSIAPALDNGPIALDGGLHIEFNRFGSVVVAAATAHATLRGATAIAVAMIPQFNKQLTCGHGWKYGATINDIQGSSLNGSAQITAKAHIISCTLFGSAAVKGDIAVIAIIDPIIIQNSGIQLQLKNLSVQSLGVYAGEFIPVSDTEVSSSGQEIGPKINNFISGMNRWLAKVFLSQSVQSPVRAYKLQIQSVQLGFQGQDLFVTVVMSGQTPISQIDRLLN